MESQLSQLDAKAKDCTRSAGPSETVNGSVSIRFGIKWNGRVTGLSVTGEGVPSSVTKCIRGAIPTARYPQPPPGKDGSVRLTLEIKPSAA